ncbi:MAG TPA: aminoacyl-tRNA hydrolase [Clostridiales bacterium]|nr:aminoacyl-tRNA hydrolase [Clostridiales bacterium]
MYLIVGLGNPGMEYETSRHNVGWLCLDRLAEKHQVSLRKTKFHALVTSCLIHGEKCLLMKPTTYMNNSGQAVSEAAGFYKIPPEKIIVISDDINLEPGKIRIRKSGSAGGHNGLKSIIEDLGSDAFPRIRIGVGDRENPAFDLADFVLGHFSEEDLKQMEPSFQAAIDSAELIVEGRLTEAMNLHNNKKS